MPTSTTSTFPVAASWSTGASTTDASLSTRPSPMRFDVITLFPDLFAPFLTQGITRRAYESGQVDVKLWPLRDHAEGTYRRVDDRPFGGGPGMVMLAEPLERALGAVASARATAGAPRSPVVLFT